MHICVSMLICLYITKVFYSNAVRMDKIFIYEVVCLLINWLIRQSRLQRTAGVVCESGIHLNCGSCSEFYSLVDSCRQTRCSSSVLQEWVMLKVCGRVSK